MSEHHDTGKQSEYRRAAVRRVLREDEQAVVSWLIDHSSLAPEAKGSFGSQLPALAVVGHCGCGCPSIDFLPARQGARVVAEATGTTPDDEMVGLILWAQDTELSGLEVYSFGERDTPYALPVLSSLATVGPSAG
jgi:hypothetical protein